MHSPHTFIGKVTTLLVGGALSWLTIMHPGFGQAMGRLLGNRTDAVRTAPESVAAIVPSSTAQQPLAEPLGDSLAGQGASEEVVPWSPAAEETKPPQAGSRPAAAQSPREPRVTKQMEQISARLRQLGASYLLLERLPHPTGDRYRVRCDLAEGSSSVQCCLEATRHSAIDAMNDVLQAVLSLDPSPQEFARAPTSSF